MPRRLITPRRFALAPLTVLLLAAAMPVAAAGTLIQLSATATQSAANDLLRATVAAEAAGPTPRDIALKVNALLAENLAVAKAYPSVKVQSGGTTTYPVYAKSGGRIDSWRMRSELALESSDATALSELLGRLQAGSVVSGLSQLPSPATRRKAEDAAMLDALAAFKARAQVLADAFGKPYRIKQIDVNTAGGAVPVMRQRAVAAMSFAESAPMPIEAGESQISVSVSGQIEVE